MIVACSSYALVLHTNPSITSFETIGMFAGAMTSTPGYGTALDAAGHVDYEKLYEESSVEEKNAILRKIDDTGALTAENTASLNEEQIAAYKENASSAISLGYTVAFPIGVLVIVVMISLLPKFFGIDMEKEKEEYRKELNESADTEKKIKEKPLDFMTMSLVAVIGIIVGNITIPLGSFGSFSLGAAGGVLLAALILSYVGEIGPLNFRMDSKSLGIMYQMGLTFFMAVVGLRYGYDVVTSLMGSGLALAVAAIFVEGIAVLVSFFIGHKVFHLNWLILSGAIAGGCTSAPGLGAAISSTDSEEPTAGYGAAQPFAILANVLLATIFFNIMM
jgi:putative transport protein